MAVIQFVKRVLSLPAQLEPNTLYFVRVGAGFDLYCTDSTGAYAHAINSSASSGGQTYQPPLGQVSFFATSGPPAGWAVCDGSLYSKTEFSFLYSAIGGRFGETETHFRLPNLLEQFVRGTYDVGRKQNSAFARHRHLGGGVRIWDTTAGPYGNVFYANVPHPLRRWDSGGAPGGHLEYTSTEGSEETRPTNVGLLPCIYIGLVSLLYVSAGYVETGYLEV